MFNVYLQMFRLKCHPDCWQHQYRMGPEGYLSGTGIILWVEIIKNHWPFIGGKSADNTIFNWLSG